MNSSVLHRRRIERYAQLLDEASGARRHHARTAIDEELSELVGVSNRLTAATPEVTVRPEFRRDTRAFLMAVAEREGIGKTAVADREVVSKAALAEPATGRAQVGSSLAAARARVTPKGRAPKISVPAVVRPRSKSAAGRLTSGRGRVAILVGLAVGTLALSGISAASGDAKPGDALYGMKRSAEGAQMALAGSDVAKGKLNLDYATKRLSEAQAVRANTKTLIDTLNTMDAQATLGAKLLFADALKNRNRSSLTAVDQFVVSQEQQLSNLKASLPDGPGRDRVVKSYGQINAIGMRSSSIRAALDCPKITFGTPDPLGQTPLPCTEASGSHPSAPITGGGEKTKPATPGDQHTAIPGTPTQSAPVITPSAVAPALTTGQDAPNPAPTDDGGLLGTVERLLGGL